MLETHSIVSSAFQKPRQIRVWLPEDYKENSGKRYPVLYIHDGQNVFRDEDAIGGVSLNLEAYLTDHPRDFIVAAIEQNPEERTDEFCPWPNGKYSRRFLGDTPSFGGKGETYLHFIVHEVKPFMDRHYRTLKNKTAMAGISLGGLITVFAACRYPHVFKNIVLFSSAFYPNQEELEALLKQSDLSAVDTFYMDWGTKEAGDGTEMSEAFSVSNQAIYELVKKKLPCAEAKVIEGGEHHYLFFRDRVRALFSFL
ncbi:alpha/beta hydrolase [Bacillus sp. H-16]|uniref:alpha/beta hydrolase n=1 Tax=Alteribacter salitolerans TaxID=2912333 RepID=UPI0019644192|nr:alpha/beta hydrolase-fold protein [Alteribacter salitolerans]MBM7095083.1 alpha/beta hydrolase [Alteribacter salitolerans]